MEQPTKTERSGCLMLFGLPFFIGGLVAFYFLTWPVLYEGFTMQKWPSTSGTLLSAKLNSYRSDNSHTYSTEARYKYYVNGLEYIGHRVWINDSSDNVGDFQEKLGRRLERAHRNKRNVPVYYDPMNPHNAVLNRTIRWDVIGLGSVFLVIFGGVGGGLIYLGWRGKKTIDTPEAADKPWLAEPDWHDNVIFSDARAGAWGMWFFAILWNLISAPSVVMGFPEVWRDEGYIALLIFLFPLVGLWLLYLAIKQTLEWKRFGRTPLTLDPFPGSIGGDVGGEIITRIRYNSAQIYKVTLTCVYSYVSGSGKNRTRKERVKWQDEGYAHAEPAAEGSRLKFRFKVPDSA